MEKNNFVERRKYKRYKALEGTIALVGNPLCIMGSVINMSKGGLAFRYIENHNEPKDISELDILHAEKMVYIDKVPFKAVSDFEIRDESSTNLFPLRQCGVQFGDLTITQASQLEDLLNNCTSEDIPPG